VTGLVMVAGMAASISPVRRPAPLALSSDQAWAGPPCEAKAPRRRVRLWRRARSAPLLGEVAPFARYPTKVLDGLGRYADRLRVREGTVLATKGRQAREAIVVMAGEVRTEAPGGSGPSRSLGPGTWLGPRQMLAGEPYADTLVAGPGLEVVVLTGPAYRWAAANLPGLADDTT
jgi:Cyclic nucleotide-binding domain